MAALREDVMADEAPVNRQRRSPVSSLLSPFKWAADSVASLADLDPAICVELCKIGPTRMHVVALVLAHLKVEPTPELGRLLLCGSIRQVIAETLGRDLPAGLERAVARMPAKVLAQENYRRLIALLDHRPTAKLLFHMRQSRRCPDRPSFSDAASRSPSRNAVGSKSRRILVSICRFP